MLFNGLGMVYVLTMDVVIQVSKGASDKKFVHPNPLLQALSNDVALNPIQTEDRPKVLRSLFVLVDVISQHSLLALIRQLSLKHYMFTQNS